MFLNLLITFIEGLGKFSFCVALTVFGENSVLAVICSDTKVESCISPGAHLTSMATHWPRGAVTFFHNHANIGFHQFGDVDHLPRQKKRDKTAYGIFELIVFFGGGGGALVAMSLQMLKLCWNQHSMFFTIISGTEARMQDGLSCKTELSTLHNMHLWKCLYAFQHLWVSIWR